MKIFMIFIYLWNLYADLWQLIWRKLIFLFGENEIVWYFIRYFWLTKRYGLGGRRVLDADNAERNERRGSAVHVLTRENSIENQ